MGGGPYSHPITICSIIESRLNVILMSSAKYAILFSILIMLDRCTSKNNMHVSFWLGMVKMSENHKISNYKSKINKIETLAPTTAFKLITRFQFTEEYFYSKRYTHAPIKRKKNTNVYVGPFY